MCVAYYLSKLQIHRATLLVFLGAQMELSCAGDVLVLGNCSDDL